MEKIKKISLVMVLVLGVFTLAGCGSKSNGYSKEVEKYKVQTVDKTASILFEFEKDDKYTAKTSDNTITIKSSENYSEVKVRALHDYKTSSTITKKEKDFYSDKYHDYKEVKVGDYSGWEIYYSDSKYEIALVLSEKDKNNKVYAVDIEVAKSPVMKEDMKFDTDEFVKSDDFKHLLDTLKLKVNDNKAE